jgi:cell division protein FtsI (penicillin-binding protein 3)
LPKETPKISITCVIDEPQPFYFGGIVAAPLFKRIAEQIIKYLEISEEERLAINQ